MLGIHSQELALALRSAHMSRAPASSLQAEAHPMDTAGVDLEKDSGRTWGGERKQQAVLGFWVPSDKGTRSCVHREGDWNG